MERSAGRRAAGGRAGARRRHRHPAARRASTASTRARPSSPCTGPSSWPRGPTSTKGSTTTRSPSCSAPACVSGGVELGVVTEVLMNPAHDILQIDAPDGAQLARPVRGGARRGRPRARRVITRARGPALGARSTSSRCFPTPSPGFRSRSTWRGRASWASSSTCGTTATPRRCGTARSTTRPTAAAPAWCCASTWSARPSRRVFGLRSRPACADDAARRRAHAPRAAARRRARHRARRRRPVRAVRPLRGHRRARRAAGHRPRLHRARTCCPAARSRPRCCSTPSCARSTGAVSNPDSVAGDSFSPGLGGALEYPHYTRPAEFRGWAVPAVLLSGDHGAVERWRRERLGGGEGPRWPSAAAAAFARGARFW